MSLDVTHKQQTSVLQSWSAESDADRLMEDLFSEIDEIVESSSKLPNEPVLPEYISLGATIVPSTDTTTTIVNSGRFGRISGRFRKREAKTSQYTHKKFIQKKNQTNFADRLDLTLFIIAFICVAAVSSWLVSREKINLNYFLEFFPRSIALNLSGSSEESQFINYMLRSIEAIDRKGLIGQQDKTNRSTVSLASAPAPTNSASPREQVQRVIEKIYIPVYPPTQIPNLPAPREFASILPSKIALPPPPLTSLKSIRATRAIKSIKIAPSPPQMSAPLLPPPPPPPTSGNSITPPSAPSTLSLPSAPKNQILRGLLENGDRSAALFDFNGNSETIRLGETIGSSGWTLISITNQKALIRRNGEERYLSVGQNF